MTSVIGFEELYRRYSADVYRFALYLSANASLAEDITSETFVRAWTSPSTLRPATVKGYLLAIARNLFIEEKRRGARRAELDESLPDRHDLVRHTEMRDAARRAIKELQTIAEGDRTALLMRVMHEMSHHEISIALGISLAAVKARIFRARLRLTEIREALEWKILI